MSLILDDLKLSKSTIEEVRKLQELVRKLELQNLHLRNKHISNNVKEHRRTEGTTSSTSHKKIDLESENKSNVSYLKLDKYFDDLEIIQVSDIELSDDESWLYSSPSRYSFDKKESPYKWLQKDVDDLENKQLQLAKRALISKLNELEIRKPYTPPSIDTRTFTRSQKREALNFLDKLDQNKCVEPLYWRKNDSSLESLGTCHVMEDANDVQEVARMQEESLRMNSPMGTSNLYSISSACPSTTRESNSDQDFSESSFINVSRTDVKQNFIQADAYIEDPLEYSNHSSSSSESHYDSNLSLHESGKEIVKFSGYRRSLPNLTNDPSPINLTKNKSKRADKIMSKKHPTRLKVLGSEKELKHLNTSLPLSKTPKQSKNVLYLKKQDFQASQSMPISNLSQNIDGNVKIAPKSCLPRPSRGHSISRPSVRSGIPAPSMLNKKRGDDAWSEGCF